MNQVTKMFMESNERLKSIMKGPVNLEQLSVAQREFEGQIKLINAVVAAYGIMSKNKRAMTGLQNMNLMDDSTAIDLMLGDPEEDKIRCPEMDVLLSRQECLDLSWSSKRNESCAGCRVGINNKQRLMPLKRFS